LNRNAYYQETILRKKFSALWRKNPRNSTTFFRAEAGDLPFGKDCGLRKECACFFNTTNNPKSLVAALGKTADLDRLRFLRKLSHLKVESPLVLLNFALADPRPVFCRPIGRAKAEQAFSTPISRLLPSASNFGGEPLLSWGTSRLDSSIDNRDRAFRESVASDDRESPAPTGLDAKTAITNNAEQTLF
jgi:hypothetical protein